MGIHKRPKPLHYAGWRCINQALGLRLSQASVLLQAEADPQYAHPSKQLDKHVLRDDNQSTGHQGICSEILKSSVGGLAKSHLLFSNPYSGLGNTLRPGWSLFSSGLDAFSKGSFGERTFATQSICHHDNELGSSPAMGLSECDAMDILSSEDDGSYKDCISKSTQYRNSSRSCTASVANHEEDDMSMSESDALDNISSDNDTAGQEYISKGAPCRNSTRANSNDSEEDYLDSSDEDEFEPSSLLDAAFAKVKKDEGDKRRPLWSRVEKDAGKGMSTLKDVLKTWCNEGYPLDRGVIVFTITILRKRGKYWQALELSDWVMKDKPFGLNEMDYGIRVELIGKVHGAHKAEDYFETIPKEFQTSMAFSILLTVYVKHNQEKDALRLLQKVDRRGLVHRTYMYNQLLHLYKKNGLMAGVAEVLQSMDEKDVEPDIYTYSMILDVRARRGDTDGMEKVWSLMKEDKKVVPSAATYAILAKGYMKAGAHEKAEKLMKKVESSPFQKKRVVNLLLIKLYGQLGKEDDLERVWALVERPRMADYIAMIRSLGNVGNVERAEAIFEDMVDKMESLHVHHYNALLSVYANTGNTQKGENVLKRLKGASIFPNSATYHELVLMYLKAGVQQKAMGVIRKAWSGTIRRRLMYDTFQTLLNWYAEKGDVKNAETVMKYLKAAGYGGAYRLYVTLLKAYTNADTPPYGFLDRIRADDIIPNKHIRGELKRLDGT